MYVWSSLSKIVRETSHPALKHGANENRSFFDETIFLNWYAKLPQ